MSNNSRESEVERGPVGGTASESELEEAPPCMGGVEVETKWTPPPAPTSADDPEAQE